MPKAQVRWSHALLLVFSAATAGAAIAGPAQYVIGNFNGPGLTVQSSASEPSIAVGPYQVLAQTQGGVAAYDKNGTQVAAFLLGGVPSLSSDPSLFYGLTGPDPAGPGGSFYVDATPNGSQYPGTSPWPADPNNPAHYKYFCHTSPFCPPGARDPLMMFDPNAQRFSALAWSYTHLNLNVSKSADLRDGWFNYHINLDPNGTMLPQDCFWDRPSMGFSNDKIVISSWWQPDEILVLDKSALLSGSYGLIPHTFSYGASTYGTHLDLPGTAIAHVPTDRAWQRVCANLSSTGEVYLLGVKVVTATESRFEVARLTGSPGGTLSLQVYDNPATMPSVLLREPWQPAKQPGGDLQIGGGMTWAAALSNPFMRIVGGIPWLTFASFQHNGLFGSALANEIRVFELNTSTWALETNETYGSANAGEHYAFPSAIRDAEGNLYVGFNASGPIAPEYPSTYVTARKAGESSLESPPTLAKLGMAFAIPSNQRWGDFTGIALDECNSGKATAYFTGQYSSSQSNSLASWVTSFRFESSSNPTACTSEGVWNKMSPNNPVPAARSGATTTWDPVNNRFILFGGYTKVNGSDYYYADTWSYAPSTNTWTHLFNASFGLANHTAIYVPGVSGNPARIVIFGGEDGSGRKNVTRALDLSNPTSWTVLSTSGPSARASHVAICDPVRNQMIVYGGVPWSAGHTWKFSFANNTWTQVSASQPPAEFEGCSAIYDPTGDRMIVFGGRLYVTASCPSPWLANSNATYSLSLASPTQWTMQSTTNPPPARAFAAAVYDPLNKRMILHGGIQDQVCDGGGPPACGQTLEKGLTDIYALALACSLNWSPIGRFCSDGPTPRGRHSAVYDVSSSKVYAFAGAERRASESTCETTRYNDLWRLTLDAVAPASVTNLVPTMSTDAATITWTAPGDDGSQGRACEYDLRYSTSTITAANFCQAIRITTAAPHAAGYAESAEVTDLDGCSWYSFALKTRDESGNWSGLSNTPKRQTLCFITGGTDTTSDSQEGPVSPGSVELRFVSEHPTQSDLKISYAVPSRNRGDVLNLSIFDLVGRRVHTLIDGKAEQGLHVTRWNLRDRQGARVKNGIYFLKLRVGNEVRQQKVMVVE